MVKDLPYPYTSKAQYERSLQTPIGTEWNTRLGFQRGTLPRVVKKACSPTLYHLCGATPLMSVFSLVLLSNLWSRCRNVFPLGDCRTLGLCRILTGPYVYLYSYRLEYGYHNGTKWDINIGATKVLCIEKSVGDLMYGIQKIGSIEGSEGHNVRKKF